MTWIFALNLLAKFFKGVSLNTSKKIGLIGIGGLGLPIARNLISSGFNVIGYRRSSMEQFTELGGVAADSPCEGAEQADIVLTCLPSGESLADAVSGSNGIVKAARSGMIVVELSTIPIEAKREQLVVLAGLGSDLLDCTVSGSPEFIDSRTAAFFVSGNKSGYENCREVIEGITDNVKFVGQFGCGSALKSISTALVSVHTLAAAEAFAMGERAGLARQDIFNAITGTPMSSGMFETRGKAMINGDYPKTRGLATYYERNMEKVRDFTNSVGGNYPLLSAALDCYAEAIKNGYGNVDYSAVIDFLMEKDTK